MTPKVYDKQEILAHQVIGVFKQSSKSEGLELFLSEL